MTKRRLATVDRLEGDLAVLVVRGKERVVPRSTLPDEAREGDVVDLETLALDPEATAALRARVAAARRDSGGGSGDFEL